MMTYLKLLLLLLTVVSCRGQEKKENPKREPKRDTNAAQLYAKQKDRFEIKGYKLLYNGQLLRSDTVKSVLKILGQPRYIDLGDFIYNNLPLTLDTKPVYDNPGKPYNQRNYIINKQGDTLKIIRKYRIEFDRFKPRYVPDKRDSILMQIPPMEGFVKVNGFFINKNISLEELKQKLKPTVKNADFFVMKGRTICVWYYGTENDEKLDKFDPRMRLSYDGYIRLDFIFFDDKLHAIDYYYDILE